MSLDTDFYSKLAGLAGLATQQGTISEDKQQPYVWFQRESDLQDTFLDGSSSLRECVYTVEVSGLDIDAVQATADTIKAALNAFAGTMGGTSVLGAFVEDASDDYQFRNTDADAGNHVAAFHVRILA